MYIRNYAPRRSIRRFSIHLLSFPAVGLARVDERQRERRVYPKLSPSTNIIWRRPEGTRTMRPAHPPASTRGPGRARPVVSANVEARFRRLTLRRRRSLQVCKVSETVRSIVRRDTHQEPGVSQRETTASLVYFCSEICSQSVSSRTWRGTVHTKDNRLTIRYRVSIQYIIRSA